MKTPRRAKVAPTENGHAPGPALETPPDRNVKGGALDALDRDAAADVESVLKKMRTEGGQGAYFVLKRRPLGEMTYAHVTKIPVDTFTEDMVKDLYGGGDYFAVGKSGNHEFVKSYYFTIDKSIPPKNPEAQRAAEAAAVKPPPAPDASAIVKDVLTQLLPMIKPAPAADNSAVMVAMIQAQSATNTAIFQAMAGMMKGGGRGEPDAAMAAQLARLEAKLENVANQKAHRSGISDMREVFEFVREIEGERDPEKKKGMLAELFEGAGPAIKQLLAGAAPLGVPSLDRQTRVDAAPASPPVTETPQPPAGAAPGPVAPADPAAAMEILFQRSMLAFAEKAIMAAKFGMSPEDFADKAEVEIDSKLPAAYGDKIFAIVSAADWFQTIFGRQPEAEAHREWLTKLRDIFVEDFNPDAGEEEKK